jgi:hypothetical protein
MVTNVNIYRQHRQVEKITNEKYIDVKALKIQHQPENMIPKKYHLNIQDEKCR